MRYDSNTFEKGEFCMAKEENGMDKFLKRLDADIALLEKKLEGQPRKYHMYDPDFLDELSLETYHQLMNSSKMDKDYDLIEKILWILYDTRIMLSRPEKYTVSKIWRPIYLAFLYFDNRSDRADVAISLLSHTISPFQPTKVDYSKMFSPSGEILKTYDFTPLIEFFISFDVVDQPLFFEIIQRCHSMVEANYHNGKNTIYLLLQNKLTFLQKFSTIAEAYGLSMNRMKRRGFFVERVSSTYHLDPKEYDKAMSVCSSSMSLEEANCVRDVLERLYTFLYLYGTPAMGNISISDFLFLLERIFQEVGIEEKAYLLCHHIYQVFLFADFNTLLMQNPYFAGLSIFIDKNGYFCMPDGPCYPMLLRNLLHSLSIPEKYTILMEKYIGEVTRPSTLKDDIDYIHASYPVFLADEENPIFEAMYQCVGKNGFVASPQDTTVFIYFLERLHLSEASISRLLIALEAAKKESFPVESKELDVPRNKNAKQVFLKNGTIGTFERLNILPSWIAMHEIPKNYIANIFTQMAESIRKNPKADQLRLYACLKAAYEFDEFIKRYPLDERIYMDPDLNKLYVAIIGDSTKSFCPLDYHDVSILLGTYGGFVDILGSFTYDFHTNYYSLGYTISLLTSDFNLEELTKLSIDLLCNISFANLMGTEREEKLVSTIQRAVKQYQSGKKISEVATFITALEDAGFPADVAESVANTFVVETQKREELSTTDKIKKKVAYYFDGEKFIRSVSDFTEFQSWLEVLYDKEKTAEILALLSTTPVVEQKEEAPALFDVFSSDEREFLQKVEIALEGMRPVLYEKGSAYCTKMNTLVSGLHADDSVRAEMLSTATYQREGKYIYIADLEHMLQEVKTRAELLSECEDSELREEVASLIAMMTSCMHALGYGQKKETKYENTVILLDCEDSPFHILSDINAKETREKKDTIALLHKLRDGLFSGDHTFTHGDLQYYSKVSGCKRAYYVKAPNNCIVVFFIGLEKDLKGKHVLDKLGSAYLADFIQTSFADQESFAKMMVDQMDIVAKAQTTLGMEEVSLVLK